MISWKEYVTYPGAATQEDKASLEQGRVPDLGLFTPEE